MDFIDIQCTAMSVTYLLVTVNLVKSLRITASLHHSCVSQCLCNSRW